MRISSVEMEYVSFSQRRALSTVTNSLPFEIQYNRTVCAGNGPEKWCTCPETNIRHKACVRKELLNSRSGFIGRAQTLLGAGKLVLGWRKGVINFL